MLSVLKKNPKATFQNWHLSPQALQGVTHPVTSGIEFFFFDADGLPPFSRAKMSPYSI